MISNSMRRRSSVGRTPVMLEAAGSSLVAPAKSEFEALSYL